MPRHSLLGHRTVRNLNLFRFGFTLVGLVWDAASQPEGHAQLIMRSDGPSKSSIQALAAFFANSNQLPNNPTKPKSNGPRNCEMRASEGAFLNRLRMRASFNPTIMSSTLEEAEGKVHNLLGTKNFVRTEIERIPHGRSGSHVLDPTRDANYFARANAEASHELVRNRDLDLKNVCLRKPSPFTARNGSMTSARLHSATWLRQRTRRGLEDPVKVADLSQIGTSKRQFCLNRGDDKDGLLRLCKMCVAVTELPETYFPRYINEVMCSSDDTGCLYAGALPHGVCQSKKLEITVLERYTNHECLEDWQPVTVDVRVSCECFVHRSSFLRAFA